MILPEAILINALRSLVTIVGNDWNAQSDKTKSILYGLFYADDEGARLSMDGYLFYEQAVILFTRNIEHPRKINIHMGYNLEQQNMLAIHVLLPKDSPGRYDSIGHSIGQYETTFDVANQIENQTLVSTYDATYQLIITGDNPNEILLLYWYLKSCFVMLSDHLELSGLRNIRVSGSDIRLDDAQGPMNIFHRSLQISFDYEIATKANFVRAMADKINLLFCANLDTEYEDATNQGGLIKTVIPPTNGSSGGSFGMAMVYEISNVGTLSSWTPSPSEIMTVSARTPLLAFRNQSLMDIIRVGSPDSNQIFISPDWSVISWSPAAMPEEKFKILYT